MKKSFASPAARAFVQSLFVESLERRALMSVSFQFDYRYDAGNFFNTQAKRDVLVAAGQSITRNLSDTFDAVSPANGNTWALNLSNPANGATTSISNPTIAANTIVVFVGARDLAGSSLGVGGPTGWSASGTTDWVAAVRSRGEPGASATPRTDFAPKAGAISFDSPTPWFFGTTTSGLTTSATDFYSVAVHELGHVLGIGVGSDTWPAFVYNGKFNGPKAKALYGGPVPVTADGGHWAEGTSVGGVEASLDPTIARGVRKSFTALDFAALDDIGYDLASSGSVSGSVFVDANNDGYRQTGETGVGGVRVFFDADLDGIYDTTETSVFTDSTGKYAFANVAAGTYRVRQLTPTGYTAVKPTAGYQTVSVTVGQARTNQDFSIAKTGGGTSGGGGGTTGAIVSGSVFNDADADGVKDAGEAGLAGWLVYADANKNGYRDDAETTALTDAGGNYALGLAAGSYRIVVGANAGYRRTLPTTGYYDLTLVNGSLVSGKTFALTQKILISGNVFKDTNGDGLKAAGEAFLSGWRVYLDKNNNGLFDNGELYATTDASGYWQFRSPAAGSFVVRVVQQTGYTLKSPASKSFAFTLTAGQSKTGLQFAEKPG